jgi:hypothetical protein
LAGGLPLKLVEALYFELELQLELQPELLPAPVP